MILILFHQVSKRLHIYTILQIILQKVIVVNIKGL